MVVPVSDEIEMLLQTGIVQHFVGVSTDGMDLSRLEVVVFVQEPPGGIPLHGTFLSSFVNNGLPVILAVGFQIQFP